MQIPNVENDHEGIIEPEVLTPEQMADVAGSNSSSQPERRLMLAVIEDAILTYERLAHQREGADREHFEEVARWIDCSDSTWLFSFESICDALGLEADAIRQTLARQPASWRCGQAPRRVRRLAGARHAVRAYG